MCPQLSKNLWAGRGGELERLCRRVGGPNQRRNADPSLPLAPAPKEDHHKVQSHFNGPISRRAQIPKLKRLAALFPFVDFGPFSAQALVPRSARALPDTTCPPFSTVSTPPSGALGPSSGPCLADTTCLPLSTCPSRLNPNLRRLLPGTGRPEKRSAQFKAIHTHPTPTATPWEGCRACPKGRPSQGAVPLQRPSLRRGPTPARCGCRACPA